MCMSLSPLNQSKGPDLLQKITVVEGNSKVPAELA
jgi:hypothetical protein